MIAKRCRIVLAALALVMLLVLPGCVVIDPANPPKWLPKSLLPAAPQTTTAGAKHPAKPGEKRADVWLAYYARKGRLAGAQRNGKPASVSPEAAMRTLLAGPTSAERKAGYVTAIPNGTRVRSVSMDFASVARLDLSREFAAGGKGASMRMRVAQVVFTLTQLPGVNGVLIKIEGKPVQQFGKERIDLMSPQTKADYAGVAPLP